MQARYDVPRMRQVLTVLFVLRLICRLLYLQISLEVEDFVGVWPVQGGDMKGGGSLLKLKRSNLSKNWARNQKSILAKLDKDGEEYYDGHPGVDADLMAADAVARKSAYIHALDFEDDVEEEELLLLLPLCPTTSEQMVVNCAEFQSAKHNIKVSNPNKIKMKGLFIPVYETLKLEKKNFKSWAFYKGFEFSYCLPSGRDVNGKTGYTPKKQSAMRSIIDAMDEMVVAAENGADEDGTDY